MSLKRLLVALLLPALIGTALAARNGSGTYNVPNTFAPGGVISSAKENANFTDIGNEITNSLPRDGQAGMTGPMRAIDGTTAQPSISFNNETGTGFRRAASGDMRLVISGVDILQFTSMGMTILAGTNSFVPVGTILDFAAASAPSGFLLADGSCQVSATYPTLATLLGTTWGSSCPAGQFTMPNIKGRVTAGYDAMGGTPANILTGAFAANVGVQSRNIGLENLPSNALGVTVSGSVTVVSSVSDVLRAPSGIFNTSKDGNNGGFQALPVGTGIVQGITSSGSFTAAGLTQSMNGGVTQQALALLQPTTIVYKIVKY